MKCPHCLVNFHDQWSQTKIAIDRDGTWLVLDCKCPACNKGVMKLRCVASIDTEYLIRPKTSSRTPPSDFVSEPYRNDYIEACLVLEDSPKASAALSRRCLQAVLRDKGKIKPGRLVDEIQQVLDSGSLPSHLSESLDAVRNIGNFAAHPSKSENTGEIIDVEPGEAEWNLDILESLFDFYFVQPEITKQKREQLNKKLSDAGKPPMKKSSVKSK